MHKQTLCSVLLETLDWNVWRERDLAATTG